MTSPARFLLRAIDVDVLVEVEDRELGALVQQVAADLQIPEPADRPARVTVSGHGPWTIASPALTHQSLDRSHALGAVLAAVNLTAVAQTTTLAFHAAVLVRGGCVVAVPGASGNGKTTLAAALLREGWTYVTDEALSLRWRSRALVPYPRPLALSPWAAETLGVGGVDVGGELLVRASAWSTVVPACDDLPGWPHHVVSLDRAPGAAADLLAVHRTEALAALLRRGFTHHHDAGRALTTVHQLVSEAQCWRLRLSDPREAARFMTARLS
ncbi:MAG TPA: hypothetical protein VHO27_02165 [Angustibacter sp.]|nr:hypothetical protein [Angustibacter sp.]